jgi:hypothetical protein
MPLTWLFERPPCSRAVIEVIPPLRLALLAAGYAQEGSVSFMAHAGSSLAVGFPPLLLLSRISIQVEAYPLESPRTQTRRQPDC